MFYLETFSLSNLHYLTYLIQMHQGKLKSCQMTSYHSKLQITHHVRAFQLCSSHRQSGEGPQSNSTLSLRQLLYTPAALSVVKLMPDRQVTGWAGLHSFQYKCFYVSV